MLIVEADKYGVQMGENRGVNGVEGFVRHGDGVVGENEYSTSVYIQHLASGATVFFHCKTNPAAVALAPGR
jgi:hypothetical protein